MFLWLLIVWCHVRLDPHPLFLMNSSTEIVLLTRAVRALGEGLVFCCLEISSAWWCRPGILALEKLRQDCEFRVSLDYMVSSILTPVHDLASSAPPPREWEWLNIRFWSHCRFDLGLGKMVFFWVTLNEDMSVFLCTRRVYAGCQVRGIICLLSLLFRALKKINNS